MYGTVHVENLTKTYQTRQRTGLFRSEANQVEALKGITLEVRAGEIYGLLGPNGAGKTTLIKVLSTLLLPTSGSATLNGFDTQTDANKVRATIGCMLMGERGLYWKLTARENLVYFGALYHLSVALRKQRANEIIELIGIGDIADRAVETYSSGQKMKLAFGKALINDAPLLILDEPTNTLDVPSASELRAIVRQMNAEGKTIIYTTHIMAEAETLCDRVAIIDYGERLAEGTVAELKASLGKDQVTRISGVFSAGAVDAVKKLPMVTRATRTEDELTIVTQNGHNTLPKLIEALTAHDALIQKIVPEETTLEDVFIAKTGRTLAENTAITTAEAAS
jgi:ABC-2 type transport system ATP-binding protein